MALVSMPSGAELDAKREYKLWPEDEFVLEVTGIDVQKDQPNPFAKDEDGNPEKRDTWLVRFKVVSFSNGDLPYFEDGTEPDEKNQARMVGFLDPSKVGTKPRASIARKFLTSILQIPTDSAIVVDSFSDIIGKRLIGRNEHRPDKTGNKRDRLVDFRPLRQRAPRAAQSVVKTDDEAKADAADLLSAANDIFGDQKVAF